MKIRLLDLHYLGLIYSPLFYELSAKSHAQKSLNEVYVSENTATTLTFRDRTANVTYCTNVTIFMHASSGGLWLTGIFFCADFLRFIALNTIWANFRGGKLHFHPLVYTLSMLNKTK